MAHAGWTRIGIAMCALVCVLAAGCITIEGTTSGEAKKQLQRSFLFRSAKLFYPGGVTGTPEDLPALDRNAVASIERTYEGILVGMSKQHAAQHVRLGAIFERPIPQRIEARIHVDNAPYAQGRPLARMEADGTLRLSTKVAQSLFRTAVLHGMQSGEPGGARFMDRDIELFGARATNEREMLDQFNRLMDMVAGMKGRGAFGDLVSAMGDDADQGDWSRMMDLVGMSSEVERPYLAPIRFLVAHEMGHLALGHFSAQREASGAVDQARCHRMETEADLYAFALLSTTPEYLAVLEGGVAGLGDSFFPFGYEEFFGSTYDLARFAPPAGERVQCEYETAAQRRMYLDRVKRATIGKGRNLTLTEMLALKTTAGDADAGDQP